MAHSMEYLPGRVDAEYRVTMSWDFKAKLLSDEPPQFLYDDGDNLVSVPVPLTGVWSLRVDSHGDDLVFKISHGTLAYAALGDRVTVAAEFAYVAGPDLQQIHTTKWTEPRKAPEPKPDLSKALTNHSILLYLQTGHIKFAPLRYSSSHGLSPDELSTKRNASLTKSIEGQPTLPPSVSPKSVYRLAHLLERNELQQKALDALASSLTILGAADELFSPVSVAYDQVRKIVFDFVVKNWDEGKATEAWRAVRNNAARGQGQAEGAAQILFDLLAAINDS